MDQGDPMHVILRRTVCGAIALSAGAAFAHGGGLNAEGCHNDRKRGGYHCHRGNGAGDRLSPAGVTRRSSSHSELQPGGSAFRNCTEARAAGAAPVRRGRAGYGPHLDRDGDGVGCE